MLHAACVHVKRPTLLDFLSVQQQQQLSVWQSSCMTVCPSVCHLFISLSVHFLLEKDNMTARPVCIALITIISLVHKVFSNSGIFTLGR